MFTGHADKIKHSFIHSYFTFGFGVYQKLTQKDNNQITPGPIKWLHLGPSITGCYHNS